MISNEPNQSDQQPTVVKGGVGITNLTSVPAQPISGNPSPGIERVVGSTQITPVVTLPEQPQPQAPESND